ncbi:universal stress protein [Nonomuraea sp. NPDC049480]|uniref:universal stress protein n=1 Tax=Nonomuraea sp. NPDC049480 TaxID=3364353 RepID=UPI0037B188D9
MIVVGVDGSRAGLEAAGWAAREAALRGVMLKVVHAMPGWALETPERGQYGGVARWMRENAHVVLAAGVDRARREAPEVDVKFEPLPGDPRPALVRCAADAELLVVGSHGLGGFRGLLLGSVAQGVAGHAPCDVVVVREVRPPRSEVVVGVDGSPAGDKAVGFAFAEAALRGVPLRAVHGWSSLDLRDGFMPLPDDGEVEKGEVRLLDQALSGWIDRYPGIEVVQEVVHGHPADVLRHASQDAALLVVGSHGYGQLAGMLLGSVSQAVLHHAYCPVAVVRTRTSG